MSSVWQSEKPVRVVLWGLGALGSRLLGALAGGVKLIEIVGAVDRDPAFVGKTLEEIFPVARGINVRVVASLEECLAGLEQPADVVYHMTESVLSKIQGQLELAMSHKLNVISAAESMFHPSLRYPEIAASLDRTAKAHGVSITGCGINPGFIFDALVLALGRVSTAVTHVRLSRVVEVSGTGPHDIDHVGFGLWPDDFRAKLASGRVEGHIGMPESIAAVAERFGIHIDHIAETWEPKTADFPIESTIGTLEPGRVIGIVQEGTGYLGDEERIRMTLSMYYEVPRQGLAEQDEINIAGSHNIHATLTPSAISILGAGLMIINATHEIVHAAPGLVNILDFSMGGPFRGGFRLGVDPARRPVPGQIWLRQFPIAQC